MSQLARRFGGVEPRQNRASGGEDGYAAVDALVALMIFSSTLICALAATQGGRQAADAGFELRQARDLTSDLLETSPTKPGTSVGEANGFTWRRIVSEPTEAYGAGAICEHSVVLTGLHDQRRFETRTNAVCPAALDT